MATLFGARSWLWVMARINFLYAQTLAKRSGRMWVTQWPYPWRSGSDKFLQQLRRDLQRDDHTLWRRQTDRQSGDGLFSSPRCRDEFCTRLADILFVGMVSRSKWECPLHV